MPSHKPKTLMECQVLVRYLGPDTRSLPSGSQVAVHEHHWNKGQKRNLDVPVEYTHSGRRRTLYVQRDLLARRVPKRPKVGGATRAHVPFLKLYDTFHLPERLPEPVEILHYADSTAGRTKWRPFSAWDSAFACEAMRCFDSHRREFNCSCLPPTILFGPFRLNLSKMTKTDMGTKDKCPVRFVSVPKCLVSTLYELPLPTTLTAGDLTTSSSFSFSLLSNPLFLANLVHSRLTQASHRVRVWQVGGVVSAMPKRLFRAHVHELRKLKWTCESYFVFHGTRRLETVDSIFRSGFRSSGLGTCFASDCFYAYQQPAATSDLATAGRLRIRRVVLSLLAVPFVVKSSDPVALDNGVTAVNVDDVENPRIFAVPQDTLALPLVWFDVSIDKP